MLTLIFNILLISPFEIALSKENTLFNIEQLTSSEMGFKKAGEAYFSPSKKIIFQGVLNKETEEN